MTVRTWPRAAQRFLVIAGSAVLTVVLSASTALAADGGSAPLLSPFDMADKSAGARVSGYGLSIDRGGITSPFKMLIAFPLELLWELYRWTIALVAWLVDWAIQFSWVNTLVDAAQQLSTSLQTNVVGRLGLLPLALTAAGFVGGIWLLKGGFASGLTEVLISLVIASLATGMLANPVAVIAGPNGALPKVQQGGLETAAAVVSNGEMSGGDPEQVRRATSGMIITNFVRKPHQLINYGAIIDNDPECKPFYDAIVGSEDGGGDGAARTVMGMCKKRYGKFADNPSIAGLISMIVLLPAALFIMILALLFTVVLILSVVTLLYESIKLVINLIRGIVPGVGRGALWHSLSSVVMDLVLVVVAIVFLAGYMALISLVFDNTEEQALAVRFLFIDLLVLAGIVLFWMQRARVRKGADRMASRLAAMRVGNGGGRASQLPQPARMPSMRSALAQTAILRHGMTRNRGLAAARAGGGSTSEGAPASLATRLGRSKVGRAGQLVGKTAALTAKSTIGAPVYTPRAAKAAKSAAAGRATAMRTKLAGAQQNAQSFGREYAHYVAVAGRLAGRVTGVNRAAGAAARKSAPAAVATLLSVGAPASGGRERPPTRQVGPLQSGTPASSPIAHAAAKRLRSRLDQRQPARIPDRPSRLP